MPIKSNLATVNYSENEVTIEIVYFSEKKTDLENIKMYDILYDIFSKPIDINGRKRLAMDIRSDTDDNNNMSFKFDIEYNNEVLNRRNNVDMMENINLNLEGGTK